MPFPPSDPSSKYKVKYGSPPGFNEATTATTRLYLRYRIVGPSQYEFEYLRKSGPFTDHDGSDEALNDEAWVSFFRGSESSPLPQRADDEQLNHLDIDIEEDTFVELFTVGNMFWSREQHAIQTKINREDFYGHLRYSHNGTEWKYFDQYVIDHQSCRHVMFKAKLNNDYSNRNHKFSFFVILKKADDQFIEYEIDPDIKNPSQ